MSKKVQNPVKNLFLNLIEGWGLGVGVFWQKEGGILANNQNINGQLKF